MVQEGSHSGRRVTGSSSRGAAEDRAQSASVGSVESPFMTAWTKAVCDPGLGRSRNMSTCSYRVLFCEVLARRRRGSSCWLKAPCGPATVSRTDARPAEEIRRVDPGILPAAAPTQVVPPAAPARLQQLLRWKPKPTDLDCLDELTDSLQRLVREDEPVPELLEALVLCRLRAPTRIDATLALRCAERAVELTDKLPDKKRLPSLVTVATVQFDTGSVDDAIRTMLEVVEIPEATEQHRLQLEEYRN